MLEYGWNHGPTYHVARRLSEEEKEQPLQELTRFELEGRIGGSLFLDLGYRRGDVSGEGWHGAVRRARLNTRGTFEYGMLTEYKIEFGMEGGSFYLNDFYLQWRFDDWIDRLRIGYFDPPVSLESLAGSAERSFMEVGTPVSAFAPGLRLGVEVGSQVRDPALTWGLSISSVGQSQNFGDASSSALRGTGRIAWRPFGNETIEAGRLVHLAFSGSYTFAATGRVRYRSRPESYLMPYLVDTDDLDGSAGLWGIEAALREGPLTVQLEFLRTVVNRERAPSVAFHGAYLQVAYVLTGEVRPYNPEYALFGRYEASQPFELSFAGLGAFEVAGRYSVVDLDDSDVHGGVMRSLNASAIWTLNRWIRVHADYVVARTRKNANAGSSRIFQGRLELRF